MPEKYHGKIAILVKHAFFFLECNCQLCQIIVILHCPFCEFLFYVVKNLVRRPA